MRRSAGLPEKFTEHSVQVTYASNTFVPVEDACIEWGNSKLATLRIIQAPVQWKSDEVLNTALAGLFRATSDKEQAEYTVAAFNLEWQQF